MTLRDFIPHLPGCASARFILLGLLSCLTGISQAQSVNPLEGNSRAITGGGSLFRAQCATCHGADAKGIATIDAPDLTMIWSERDLSVSEVFSTIRDGVPGSIMPPHKLTDSELWMLVSYLQDVAVAGVTDLPAGDVVAGAEAFRTNCSACHRAHGQGGSFGPNLNAITTRRSLESIMASVRQPSVIIGRGFKPVRVVTSGGEEVQGVLKSEDAFSLQMLDERQRLRGFQKTELQSLERLQQSVMPPFSRTALSDSDLYHILNYIQSGAAQ